MFVYMFDNKGDGNYSEFHQVPVFTIIINQEYCFHVMQGFGCNLRFLRVWRSKQLWHKDIWTIVIVHEDKTFYNKLFRKSNWHSNFAVKENMLAVYKFPLELDDFLSL